MEREPHDCPDCESEMHSINLFEGPWELPLCYTNTADDAERSGVDKFFQRHTKIGKVAAKMCESCGRIVLYGEEKPE